MIEFFILLCEELLRIHNYQICIAISMALQSTPIRRSQNSANFHLDLFHIHSYSLFLSSFFMISFSFTLMQAIRELVAHRCGDTEEVCGRPKGVLSSKELRWIPEDYECAAGSRGRLANLGNLSAHYCVYLFLFPPSYFDPVFLLSSVLPFSVPWCGPSRPYLHPWLHSNICGGKPKYCQLCEGSLYRSSVFLVLLSYHLSHTYTLHMHTTHTRFLFFILSLSPPLSLALSLLFIFHIPSLSPFSSALYIFASTNGTLHIWESKMETKRKMKM